LNNVEVSSDYATKLKKTLEQETQHLFNGNPKEMDLISTCLTDLGNISKTYKDELLMVILAQNYLNLKPFMEEVNSRLITRIAIILQDVGIDRLRYDLDEEKFMEYEINDPFVERFLVHFGDLFHQYKVYY
jgi:hypothetical protein